MFTPAFSSMVVPGAGSETVLRSGISNAAGQSRAARQRFDPFWSRGTVEARASPPRPAAPCIHGGLAIVTPILGYRLAQTPRQKHVAGMSDTQLDVKGMNCPLPVLRANRALRTMAAGERLRVLATDRAAVGDFQSYCQETGHALLAWSEEAGIFSFLIRRRADEPKDKGG